MNVLKEIKDHLIDEDPAEVCDLLDITSEELVERFDDRIEDKMDELKGIVVDDSLEAAFEDS